MASGTDGSCAHSLERSDSSYAMLNEAPIFVNAFARGGSTILVNLLLSHPNVCYLSAETHKVFRGGARFDLRWHSLYRRIRYELPLLLGSGDALFRPRILAPRRELSQRARRHIDWVLYREKLNARDGRHNRFVREGTAYTDSQIAQARVLCKNVNGIVMMTDNFAAMYPDATFFGLIRNGLALCEGYVRRGIAAEDCAQMYRLLVGKMFSDASRLRNYHIVRFEDLTRDPVAAMQVLYRHARLDFEAVEKVRMQLQFRPTTSISGEHRLERSFDRQIAWYAKADLPSLFRTDIDRIQAARLSARHREAFLKIAGDTMEMLGYSSEAASHRAETAG
jgi:hypothetical protein